MTTPIACEIIGYTLIKKREIYMNGGFDINSFCDSLDDDYGVFDDLADSLDFRSVGISTVEPANAEQKTSETNKKKSVKACIPGRIPSRLQKKRGRKLGQKPTCSQCGIKGHTKRKCIA